MAGSIVGLPFVGFMVLTLISLFTALVVHYAVRYRVVEGFDGFLWKWVIGWGGAWLGSPVLGDWFHRAIVGHVFIVPAFIGGFIGAFIATFIWKAEAKVLHVLRTTN